MPFTRPPGWKYKRPGNEKWWAYKDEQDNAIAEDSGPSNDVMPYGETDAATAMACLCEHTMFQHLQSEGPCEECDCDEFIHWEGL